MHVLLLLSVSGKLAGACPSDQPGSEGCNTCTAQQQ
jgi:hypothetical protein